MAGNPGFADIQKRFADLWQSLVHDDGGRRSDEDRRMLIDRVRDALDRGEHRLSEASVDIIGNTFVIEERSAGGRLTEIFRTRHRDLGSQHAVKTVHSDHSHDPIARRMLLQEAEIGLALGHPHIIQPQILLRLDDGRPALVLEWCENSLADRLASTPSSPDEIRVIMTAMLEGLSAIHERGFVHCDLSPANILFAGQSSDTLRIADFGIALRSGEAHRDLDISFAGHPDFAAPEQKEGGVIDHRADLFAAGRILSLMLRNCGDAEAIDLHALAGRLSQPLPQDRPENAKAALQMLGGL
ncbi:type VI secretion system protein ImpN [Neorhizobium huautlense]|uniref:Type VI secretion system protein ImpN n=1 Tax=Neorhizobium huautlense TaxID=67774 RepID=A0ABT9PRE4_9HYPH|nr:serine/threonine-protein kinase [Neorhizobium huautlense]MDP9837041.1 type VI secretion system protein ImpN [Neorhizobium huautlense]